MGREKAFCKELVNIFFMLKKILSRLSKDDFETL